MKLPILESPHFLCYFLFSNAAVAVDQCTSKKPQTCAVYPHDPDTNATLAFQQIKEALVNVSPEHVTSYSDHDAVFRAVIESDEVTLLAYVDGCKADLSVCALIEDESRKERVCTFSKVSAVDNGKQVQFYGYSPGGAQLCYNDPPSTLSVIEPPDIANVSHHVDMCTGVLLNVNSSDDTSSLKIELDDHLGQNVYSCNYSNVTSSLSVVIPPEALSNHTSAYIIRVIPSNPAGNGLQTTVTVNLSHSHFIRYEVEKVSLKLEDTFYVTINIKANRSCPLTIPNLLHFSSSCTDEEVDFMINQTHIVNDLIPAELPLPPYKHNCTVHVKDDNGAVQSFLLKNGTYHTQSVTILKDQSFPNTIFVGCSFIKGSRAEGCLVEVLNESNATVTVSLYPTNHHGYAEIGPVTSGTYVVLIYDFIDGVKHGPLHRERVNIVSSTSSSEFPVTTSSLSSSVPMQPTCVGDKECRGNTREDLSMTLTFVGVGVIVLLVIGILLIILSLLVLLHKGQCQTHDIQSTQHCEETGVGNGTIKEKSYVDIKLEDQKPRGGGSMSLADPGSMCNEHTEHGPSTIAMDETEKQNNVEHSVPAMQKNELKEKDEKVPINFTDLTTKEHSTELIVKHEVSVENYGERLGGPFVPSHKPQKKPLKLQLYDNSGQKKSAPILYSQGSTDDLFSPDPPLMSDDSANTGAEESQVVTTPTSLVPKLPEGSTSFGMSPGGSDSKTDSTIISEGMDEYSALLNTPAVKK